MDIRKTEEFKAQQQKIIEERKAEEISGINIVKNLRRTEMLRALVYEDSQLGYLGPTIFLGFFGFGIALITMTPKFSNYFPNFARFLNNSLAVRVLIVLFFSRVGSYYEQIYYENEIKKKEYQDYISAYNYTNDLIARKIESIPYDERLFLLTGIDLREYFKRKE